MKNIEGKLIELIRKDYCSPQISKLARTLKQPTTTIHYNIKMMEKDGKIIACKAVFDHKKINRGLCTYVLINLSPSEYADPEKIARVLAKFDEIESIDIVTGDWELILKIRTKDMEEYYAFVRSVLSREGVAKIKSLSTLRQIKTEFIALK